MRNLAKREGEKFPGGHPPTKSEGSKMYFSERGGLRSQAPALSLQSLPMQDPRWIPAWCPTSAVTPWTPGPGTEPEEGTGLPSSSSCVGLSTTQHRGLCVSRLVGRIWELTKRFCPHNFQRGYCSTDGV